MNTLNKKALVSVTTRAPSEGGRFREDGREKHLQNDYTALEWFFNQGARFVRVAAWNAKVNAPGKQPIENAWQKKPLALKDVLPHLKNGGMSGCYAAIPQAGFACLTLTTVCRIFSNTFRG